MINRGAALLILLVAGARHLAEGADYPGTVRQHHRSDAEIQVAVLRGVVANPSAFVTNLEVRVNGGVVELTGTVRTVKAKLAAEGVAKSVPGVHEVHDALVVEHP